MSVQFNSVSFSYGDTEVFRNVSWQLPPSGVVCLWGPSGCGKTTLLRLLAGLEKPQSGTVTLSEKVAMVFQEDRLLPWLSALENITVTGADVTAADAILSALGLGEEEKQSLPAHLSGGQQRRVALARALVSDGDLLLLDEPFNGLDEGNWQSVVPLIMQYAAHRPVVIVTHIRQQAEVLEAKFIHLDTIPQCGDLEAEKF